jgi:hypothetical protein
MMLILDLLMSAALAIPSVARAICNLAMDLKYGMRNACARDAYDLGLIGEARASRMVLSLISTIQNGPERQNNIEYEDLSDTKRLNSI